MNAGNELTTQMLMVILAILGLTGGIFTAFAGLRERMAKIETNIDHILRALKAHVPNSEREE